jgi:peptide/nickel transport system substrate-binding protein
MVLVITGCGSRAGPGAGGSGDGQAGGILYRTVLYGDPDNMDPILSSRTSSVEVQVNVFNTLLRNDWAKAGEITGDAAEKWEVSPDGKTLTFKLRKGMKFQHNLREATAADWKYSFERALDKKWNSGEYVKLLKVDGAEDFREGRAPDVKGLKAVDDYTFQIILKETDSAFLQSLCENWAAVVPKDYIAQVQTNFGFKPVGTGPFKLKAYKKDDYVAVERFKEYDLGPALLEGQVFRTMNEANTRQAEFLAGNLDFTVVTDIQYKQFTADPKWKDNLIEVPELFTRSFFMNTTKKPFDDVRVRLALNYAVDKQALIEKVLYNKAFPTTGPLPSSSPGYNKELAGYPYDVDKARKLLAEAGYPNGFEFELTVGTHPVVGASFADALSQYFTPLGVKIKVKQVEGATLDDVVNKGDFQAAGYSTGGDVDPVNFLWTRFYSTNAGMAGNGSRYSNPKVDQLLDQAKATADPKKRLELVHEAEQIITEEAPWFIYNYNKAVILHQPWVHGLQKVPTDIDFQDMHKVWIDKAKQRSNWP